MERCSFGNDKCSVECKKYSMCSYMSIQKQLSQFQEQIAFIYDALKNVIDKNEGISNNIKELDEKLMIFTSDLLDLYNDSETKKESVNNEEEN